MSSPSTCNACGGIVPSSSACPNCALAAPGRNSRPVGRWPFLFMAASAGVAAVTLMACYGMPPCEDPEQCDPIDADAGTEADGGVDAGTTPAAN